MRKHNQIHTLGAPHYKVHFRFEDFKCALWSEKCGSCPDLFSGNHLPTVNAKTCEQMLHHRAVYGDNCGAVWVLRTTGCGRRAVHPKEEHREFALINQRWAKSQNFKFLGQKIGCPSYDLWWKWPGLPFCGIWIFIQFCFL